MSSRSLRDVPLKIRSLNTISERRVTPSWTLAQFKARLEPITGIPPSCQVLLLHVEGNDPIPLKAEDESSVNLSVWELQPQAEIEVQDSRPEEIVKASFIDTSSIPKYTMSQEVYERLPSTVLAWKKANKLGRFDSNASDAESQMAQRMWQDIQSRDISVSRRCQIGREVTRRGEIAFVGEVPEIPGLGGPWIGVILDEPCGKNDGSIEGQRYFECAVSRGLFVRPDRIEVGEFPVADDGLDEELEEL